jgi:alpha-tubulin suppressor-like RCC1 family protein
LVWRRWSSVLGCGEDTAIPTDPTTQGRSPAVTSASTLAFRQISAGGWHTCALTTTDLACGLTAAHQAYCWGNNTSGQLGDGSHTPRSTPVPVRQ